MHRREFLASLPVLASGLAGVSLMPACARRDRLRILVLGGTNFVGPYLIDAARGEGHEVTLFNRGVTNPDLFPDVEHLRGNRYPDRDEGLTALDTDRAWDAVIDTWQAEPGCVTATADLLAGRVERYVYLSSIAVYQRFRDLGITEDAAPDASEHSASFDESLSYPIRKRAGEQAVERALGNQATVLRCTSIQGPWQAGNPGLSYWPFRFLCGGPVLVPDDPAAVVQLIDVRDMARFAVLTIGNGFGGAFNVVGPEEPLPLLDYLDVWADATDRADAVVPVARDFLHEHGVRPWDDIPSWIPPDDPEPGFYHIDNARARTHGLTYRPLEATIRAGIAGLPRDCATATPGGLPRERELELLAAWRARV